MLILQIDPTILIALIGVLGGVLPVGITYVLTKNKEINASIREEKTKRYDDLLEALTLFASNIFASKLKDNRIVKSKESTEITNNFVAAYNRASTYASDQVLDSCNNLLSDFYDMLDNPDQDPYFMEFKADVRVVYRFVRLDINPKARSWPRVMFPEPKQTSK